MIEASQRMIIINSQRGELGGINPAIKRYLELEIEDTRRLVTEIEMLKVELCLVSKGSTRVLLQLLLCQHFTSSRRLRYD
jgi:hypothetical protein